jgi:hypothetical protein
LGKKRRRKRAGNSLFLELSPNERWPIGQPIPFVLDKSLSNHIICNNSENGIIKKIKIRIILILG